MQQLHTHTQCSDRRVEAKKLLSCRRQSDSSVFTHDEKEHCYCMTKLHDKTANENINTPEMYIYIAEKQNKEF